MKIEIQTLLLMFYPMMCHMRVKGKIMFEHERHEEIYRPLTFYENCHCVSFLYYGTCYQFVFITHTFEKCSKILNLIFFPKKFGSSFSEIPEHRLNELNCRDFKFSLK